MRTLWEESAISNRQVHISQTPADSEKRRELIILMIGREHHHLRKLRTSPGLSPREAHQIVLQQIPSTLGEFPSRFALRDQGKPRRRYRQDVGFRAQTFQSGEIVPQSGIYEAIHEGDHRQPHEVVLIEADLFPPCDTCAEKVRFRLVRTAPYIFTDVDFERPE
jgi:hypothetical protein